MKVISDATPLIHLAKIGKINFLEKLFDKIIIEKEIYKEVVEEGENFNKTEVLLINNLIKNKFIIVKEAKKIIEIPSLHKGEKKSISLCRELKIKELLIDEKEGFNSATMFGLNPIRTTSILIILLDKKFINFKQYKSSLRELSESGYFLDAGTYEKLLNIGKNIKNVN